MADVESGPDHGLVAAIARGLDDADVDEAAAIASAIRAHLADRERAAATAATASGDDSRRTWEDREWEFVGRLVRNRGPAARRIPDDAPADAWSAAGRSDRF